MNSSKVIADIVWETIEFACIDSLDFFEDETDINESVQRRAWSLGMGLDYEKYRIMIGV